MKSLIVLLALITFVLGQDIKDRSYLKYGKPYQVHTECKDGYKFLVATSSKGISVTQIYEARSGSKPARPVECD